MRTKAVSVVSFGLLLSAAPALAQQAGDGPVQPGNTIVREVVRMLEAGVDEEVILLWLEQDGRRRDRLSADDLIVLTRSDASRELIDALLGPPETTPPPEPAERLPQPTVAEGATVPLELSIAYRPYRDPEGEEDEQWQLFVYLDGRPLAWSDGKNWLSKSKRNRELAFDVPAGPHVLRLVQERHHRRGDGWMHDARVCPDPIEFDTRDGAPQIGIEIKAAAGLGFGKSVYRWTRVDGGNAQESPLPGPPDSWPALCEDIESNYTDAEKIPRRVKKQLERCVRWPELWPAAVDAPDRGSVRSELQRYEFRPLLAAE